MASDRFQYMPSCLNQYIIYVWNKRSLSLDIYCICQDSNYVYFIHIFLHKWRSTFLKYRKHFQWMHQFLSQPPKYYLRLYIYYKRGHEWELLASSSILANWQADSYSSLTFRIFVIGNMKSIWLLASLGHAPYLLLLL